MRVKRGDCEVAPECKGRGKRDIPEKTRLPATSSGTIPKCGKSGGSSYETAERRTSFIYYNIDFAKCWNLQAGSPANGKRFATPSSQSNPRSALEPHEANQRMNAPTSTEPPRRKAVQCWDTEIGCAQPARSVYPNFSLWLEPHTFRSVNPHAVKRFIGSPTLTGGRLYLPSPWKTEWGVVAIHTPAPQPTPPPGQKPHQNAWYILGNSPPVSITAGSPHTPEERDDMLIINPPPFPQNPNLLPVPHRPNTPRSQHPPPIIRYETGLGGNPLAVQTFPFPCDFPAAKYNICETDIFGVLWGRGFLGARVLASNKGKPGSVLALGFSQTGILPDDVAGRRVFSGSPIYPALVFRCCSGKIHLQRVYSEVTFATGSEFIGHAPNDSTPIADLQSNTKSVERRRIVHCEWLENESHQITAVSLLASHQGEPGSIPGRVTPEFSYMGIVPVDATGGRVFSGISRFPRPFNPVPLHIHLNHPLRLALLKILTIKDESAIPMRITFPVADKFCYSVPPESHSGMVFLVLKAIHGKGRFAYTTEVMALCLHHRGDAIACSTGTVDATLRRSNALLRQKNVRYHLDAAYLNRWTVRARVNPGRVTPGFFQVGVVPDDDAVRRVFSGFSRSPPLLHSGVAPGPSLLRAGQIAQLSGKGAAIPSTPLQAALRHPLRRHRGVKRRHQSGVPATRKHRHPPRGGAR
ncbi:hypothetical protein PR048_022772 [Dryococelus australis]|uniref:Uncharacterized protein n=1 Tax=Dryococelus australis TaxID=614101 RepID=A0ABQ9GS92_9NEOP|nr:hypothetical protein PR048_022772 [Dryococelus australis]